jgi:hypothetical protein
MDTRPALLWYHPELFSLLKINQIKIKSSTGSWIQLKVELKKIPSVNRREINYVIKKYN